MNIREESEQVILNPGKWPRWPVLPLKKENPMRDGNMGFLANIGKQGYTVYIGNMYDLKPGLLEAQIESMPKKHYSSIAELLDDGWMVD